MRILALADTHIGAGQEHRADALADTDAELDQVVAHAVERNVDLLLHGGDLFHRTRPSPAELHTAKRFFDNLADENIPAVLIHGNGSHSAALNTASAEELFASPGLVVSRQPEVVTRFSGVAICTLPAVPLGNLIARGETDRAEANEQAVSLLLQIARDLFEAAPDDRPRVLLGHWAVSGASLPTGLPVADLHEPVLPLWALEEIGYDACLFGHIHSPEIIAGNGHRIVSLGSPMCMDFGEAAVEHGCWLLDGAYGCEFIPLDDRRFVTVDCNLTADPEYLETMGLDETDRIAAALAQQFPLTDAVVRIRYRATEDQHRRIDAGALKRLCMDAGAHRVYQIAPEIVRADRARAAVDETLSPLAAVDAWLAANEIASEKGTGLRELTARYLERVA